MKIGILTFHRASNLGAVLQAYALCSYINEYICPAELVDFYPNNAVNSKQGLVHRVGHVVKQTLLLRKSINSRKQLEKYETFMKKYRVSEKTYYGDEQLRRNSLHYDMLISGGDQILNTTLSGCSESYYLNFDNQTPKISYASSFGRLQISDDEKRLVKEELPKFRALAVREKSGAEIIKELTGLDAEMVVDPVFLLEQNEWERLSKLPQEQKYIFVYAMEDTSELRETVKKVREMYNIPIIAVFGGKRKSHMQCKIDECCGPEEFLGYIKNAEVIVTNSYHGAAFSIVFEKKFYIVAHSTRNVRLENLLEITGNSEKLITGLTKECSEKEINGVKAMEKMIDMIKQSKGYLNKVITNNVNKKQIFLTSENKSNRYNEEESVY
jgi:hypothetical protein